MDAVSTAMICHISGPRGACQLTSTVQPLSGARAVPITVVRIIIQSVMLSRQLPLGWVAACQQIHIARKGQQAGGTWSRLDQAGKIHLLSDRL
jgi:hypothetical protein